jgi:hypothetical protein
MSASSHSHIRLGTKKSHEKKPNRRNASYSVHCSTHTDPKNRFPVYFHSYPFSKRRPNVDSQSVAHLTFSRFLWKPPPPFRSLSRKYNCVFNLSAQPVKKDAALCVFSCLSDKSECWKQSSVCVCACNNAHVSRTCAPVCQSAFFGICRSLFALWTGWQLADSALTAFSANIWIGGCATQTLYLVKTEAYGSRKAIFCGIRGCIKFGNLNCKTKRYKNAKTIKMSLLEKVSVYQICIILWRVIPNL